MGSLPGLGWLAAPRASIASEHLERAPQPSPCMGLCAPRPPHGAEHPGLAVRMLCSAKGCWSLPCPEETTACREEERGSGWETSPTLCFCPCGHQHGAAAPKKRMGVRPPASARAARHGVGLQQHCLPHRPPPPLPLTPSCAKRPGRACRGDSWWHQVSQCSTLPGSLAPVSFSPHEIFMLVLY